MLREALRIRRAVAPHQSLQIALTIHGLAQLLALAGNEDELVSLAEETISAWREALPSDSLLLARILTEYGIMYIDRADLATAESLLQEAANIFRASDDPAPQHRTMALRGLLRIQESREQPPADFVRTRLEFIDDIRGVAGQDQQPFGAVLYDTVVSFKKLGRQIEAIPLCREVIELARAANDRVRYDDGVRHLGNLAWDIAREPQRTEREYRIALRAIEDTLAEAPGSPAFINTLGVLQYRLGQYEEALRSLERSHAAYSQEYEGGVPSDLAFIALAHHELGHDEEARRTMQQLYTVMSNPVIANLVDNQMHFAEAEAVLGEAVTPEPEPEAQAQPEGDA
jgi:tetratricopeptide (TPR) repeat protein